MKEGTIFKIQSFSTFDGPGIRTAVFFKGCPLRCEWCFNPESQRAVSEILHYPNKCIGCASCEQVCAPGAIYVKNEQRMIDRSKCTDCLTCAQVCLPGAMRVYGKSVTSEKIVEECAKDMPFYGSDGGVTLTGGEVLMQPDFALEILRGCREKHINTVIETCGYGDSQALKSILQYVDRVIFDVKLIDPLRHERFTGKRNDVIIQNLRLAAEVHNDITISIPVIPGRNDSIDEIEQIAELVLSLKAVHKVDLHPFSAAGSSKYKRMFREYAFDGIKTMPTKETEKLAEVFVGKGLSVNIGG